MKWLSRWKRWYLVPIAVLVIIGGWMWQARNTQNEFGLCYHAHFEGHGPSLSPRYDMDGIRERGGRFAGGGAGLTFIRHYHSPTQLGYCAGHTWDSQLWRYGAGWIGYQVREYEPSDEWPEEPGRYIFVRHTDDRLFPIYAGYTDNLRESLSIPGDHEKADCITENGTTHIHARSDNPQPRFVEDHNEYLVRAFSPPCNEGHRTRLEMGTELVEGHIVSWTGESGEDYTYVNDGNYPDAPGNYAFAKYEQRGYDSNWNPHFEWVLLYVGEADSLLDRLTQPDNIAILPWECSVSLGATHIFVHIHGGDRQREVNELDGEHHPSCNKLYRK